jgi:thiamine-monophosphate kinase
MKNPGEEKTPLSTLGKYGLIKHITEDFNSSNKSTLSVIGDDAAIIDPSGSLTLVSTDLILEGIHFNLVYTPLKHLGYKSVVRAISDIYAMNGNPGQILISIGLSKRFNVEQVDELFEGIRLACIKYGTDLAGGDTTSSLTGLTIGVTAIGTAEPGKIVLRSGAAHNDLICVTGDFGASYMGLQLLERERKLFEKTSDIQPDLSGYEYIIGKQLKPEFPVEVLLRLDESGLIPTSMIDVSEGLASDMLQISNNSNVGCRIYADRIPVDQETARMAGEFNIDPLVPALNGGEDYELLFTIPLKDFEKIKTIGDVKVIGHISEKEKGNFLVAEDGKEIELKARGWKV